MRTETTRGAGISNYALACLAVIAVGFALRLFRLTDQSMWWDEGISLYLSQQGWQAMTVSKDFSLDLHPPLYHLLLGLWTQAAGTSVFSARFFSVLCGVGSIALLFPLGKRLGSELSGLLAAALLALSAINIYYSQETRMYALMPALALLSQLSFLLLWEAKTRRGMVVSLLAYVFSTAAGLWTYYYIGLLVVAQNLAFLHYFWRRRASLKRWLAAQALTGLLFLPWVIVFVGMLGSSNAWQVSEGAFAPPSLPDFARDFWLAFLVGFNQVQPWAQLLGLLGILLAAAGGFAIGRRHGCDATLVLTWLVAPPLLTYLIATQRQFYFPRFVLFSSFAIYLLIAVGTAFLTRRYVWARVVIVAGLLSLFVPGLVEHYGSERTAYASADYLVPLGSAAGFVGSKDLVVSREPWAAGYALAYLPATGQQTKWANKSWLDGGQANSALDKYQRVWLLSWLPPNSSPDLAPPQLLKGARTDYFERHGEFALLGLSDAYAQAPPPLASNETVAEFGGRIALLEFLAQPQTGLQPGDGMELRLVWSALSPLPADVTQFVQLLDSNNAIHGQLDVRPANGLLPVESWQPGGVVVEHLRLPVSASAPADDYRVIAGWYEAGTGKRLTTEDGADHIILTSGVRIDASGAADGR